MHDLFIKSDNRCCVKIFQLYLLNVNIKQSSMYLACMFVYWHPRMLGTLVKYSHLHSIGEGIFNLHMYFLMLFSKPFPFIYVCFTEILIYITSVLLD